MLHVEVVFRDAISEARRASGTAVKQLGDMKLVNPCLPLLVALSLWSRCVVTCQAAILLGTRGMGVDGLTLLRNAFESLFHCGALLQDPSVLIRLRNKDDYERLKQATLMLDHKETMDVLTPENRAAVEAFLRAAPSHGTIISAFECAQVAGLEGLYHSAYRSLSLVAAHPSLTTAGHAFGASIFDLRFGPSVTNLDSVFGLARDCLNIGCSIVEKALASGAGRAGQTK